MRAALVWTGVTVLVLAVVLVLVLLLGGEVASPFHSPE
jgi:hypothetical protein